MEDYRPAAMMPFARNFSTVSRLRPIPALIRQGAEIINMAPRRRHWL
jgi:hypothetical protein